MDKWQIGNGKWQIVGFFNSSELKNTFKKPSSDEGGGAAALCDDEPEGEKKLLILYVFNPVRLFS